jgi:hypothetical protein
LKVKIIEEVSMDLVQQALRASGYFYSTWHWATMPLINDPNGFPKRPFVDTWQKLRLPWVENLYGLPWDRATGLGIILGEASGNLAVIDVDDEELAQEVMAFCKNTRRISTIRNRGHIYVIEKQPSRSQVLTIHYKGRNVTIELKANGTQVAAPATPGYSHVGRNDDYPVEVSTVATAWAAIAEALQIQQPQTSKQKIWQPRVETESRNNTMYREAHSLREAGLPLENALKLLRVRWEEDYQQGDQGWQEIENTIRSAYRKGLPYNPVKDGGQYELDIFRK